MAMREASDGCTAPFPPGYWHWHVGKMEDAATRGAPGQLVECCRV